MRGLRDSRSSFGEIAKPYNSFILKQLGKKSKISLYMTSSLRYIGYSTVNCVKARA